MTAAVRCRNVAAHYRGAPVLHDISLEIGEGQMVALLGPNGAGKSTLLRVLTGLLPQSAGQVELFGRDIRQLPDGERARLVAVVPQEVTTPMSFTVAELVAHGRAVPRGRWARFDEADRREIERVLAFTDTLELRDRFYSELSGGEKQRTIIAMALAQDPRLLLLDEPTAHLDINHRLEVLQLLERLNRERGLTVLMTSHDLNLAAEFFPQLALLSAGRLAAFGSVRDVFRPEILEDVYHCKLAVHCDATGTAIVTANRPATLPTGKRVHVVCGGGSGTEILRRLCLGGWQVSCGVLNQGDTDAQAAQALGIPVVLEKPFSPVSPDALRRAADMAQTADLVIVCEIPFGPGNLAVLDLARPTGKPVYLNTRQAAARDFTQQREAEARLRQLVEQGALAWEHVGDLLIELEKRR